MSVQEMPFTILGWQMLGKPPPLCYRHHGIFEAVIHKDWDFDLIKLEAPWLHKRKRVVNPPI